MTNQERYHGLDFVRAIAMLLGVVIHTSAYFRDDYIYPWIAGEYRGDGVNTFLVDFIHFFRMQIFMLLAGFFAELVYQRKGMDKLYSDRVKRIFWPFLFGIFVFVPFTMYISNWTSAGAYTNVFDNADFFETAKSYILWGAFSDKPVFDQKVFWHFWFIYFLMFYYVLHRLFHMLGERDFLFKDNSMLNRIINYTLANKWGFLILSMLAFPIHYSLQSPMFWPSHFNFQINEMIYYLGFYIFGVYLHKNISLLASLGRHCWFYLVVSLPFIFLLNEPTTRHDIMSSVVVDITSWKIASIQLWGEGIFANGLFKVIIVFLRCAISWTLCLGFIGLAHRYLNNPSRYVRYLADSAYWVFWVHVLFTVYFSRYAQQLSFGNSMLKAVIVFYLSIFFMYFLYNKMIRYSFLGDYFMGGRKDPSGPDERYFSITNLTKKMALPCLVSVCMAFFCGYLFDSINANSKREALAESIVARDQNFLNKFDDLSGVQDRYGRNPLHCASMSPESTRRYDPIPILLGKAVDINGRDFVGRTPLFYAVRKGNIKDAELLIDSGADMQAVDKYGHTPAHVAAIKTGAYGKKASDNNLAILKLLREKGADLTLKDYKGRTAHDCLKFFGKRELD